MRVDNKNHYIYNRYYNHQSEACKQVTNTNDAILWLYIECIENPNNN